MKTIRLFVGLVGMCMLLCSVLSASAAAQIGPWGVWAPWYTYPFGSYTGSYGTVPTPPYFAIHPPVYYGPRIRMAYGHSPIARPPLTVVGFDRQEETPEAPLQSGLTIWNPYVADAKVDVGVLGQIRQRMQEFVDQKQIAGSVTLVAYRGRVIHLEAVGAADLESHQPMRPDTMFCIASMTKPVTATAVMILQDEGKLSVDDPVSKYVPAFADVALRDRKPKQAVTLRHCLTHTAGLSGSQQNEGSLQETVEKLARRPLDFEPGTKWQYSPGLSVCGRVVEVVSGRPFEEFLAERIFRPLKMADTTFHPSPAQQQRLARLYQPGEGGKSLAPATHWLVELAPDKSPNPSGGLFSTASDMARFYQMILNGGELDGQRIVSAAAVREMTKIQTGELMTGFTDGNAWGLGCGLVRRPQGVTAMLSPGTFGHGGAFGTQSWADPQRQMIFVLMIQRTGFGNGDASEIRRVFQELAVKATGG